MYEVNVINQGSFTAIEADGGTRRERGARIGAAVRRMKAAGLAVEKVSVRYDEGYGFLPRTTARYRVTTPAQIDADKLARDARDIVAYRCGVLNWSQTDVWISINKMDATERGLWADEARTKMGR